MPSICHVMCDALLFTFCVYGLVHIHRPIDYYSHVANYAFWLYACCQLMRCWFAVRCQCYILGCCLDTWCIRWSAPLHVQAMLHLHIHTTIRSIHRQHTVVHTLATWLFNCRLCNCGGAMRHMLFTYIVLLALSLLRACVAIIWSWLLCLGWIGCLIFVKLVFWSNVVSMSFDCCWIIIVVWFLFCVVS